MFKRVVFSASAIAAILGIILVILPTGAIGSERPRTTTRSHDRYALFQSIEVNDVVDGDLLVLGGDVTFTGAGRVNGNVIYAGGKLINSEGRIAGQA